MNHTMKKVAVGSAFALFASTTLTGVASAAPASGSLGSGSLGSLAPAFTSPHTLSEDESQCSDNYFTATEKWEINWGKQHTDQGLPTWDSEDFGGLTYIDPQYATKTPEEELAIIEAAENASYQWYPSRDMVSNGADLTLGFANGDVILGEAMVGSDNCPSVRWTHFPEDGVTDTDAPDDFPEGAPAPTKPSIPSDSPMGSLGSLFSS